MTMHTCSGTKAKQLFISFEIILLLQLFVLDFVLVCHFVCSRFT